MRRARWVGVAVATVAASLLGSGAAFAGAPANPGDTKDCADFATWEEANRYFWTYVGLYGDVARLDGNLDLLPCEALAGAPATNQLPVPVVGAGYWMLDADGAVYGFGDSYAVPAASRPPDAVAIAPAPDRGYWILGSDGRVFARRAGHFGNVPGDLLADGERPASIAGVPDGTGYWIFTDRGRAIPFGSAQPHGDMSGVPLNGSIVASAATPTGLGYWMVGSDGGIFSFGDAVFSGSTGGFHINRPVVGIAPDPDGLGYWLVASDGGIFAFDAPFRGSLPEALGGQLPNRPVIGALSYGDGYLMVASDGGIFSFSDRQFLGSLGDDPPDEPVVGVAVFTAPPI